MKLNYRPEIDGLRAIAVISVIIYHAKITFLGKNLFQGGYIGVDIFFVISGYLISLIIFSEIKRNCFSLKNFYERRARRILPVLLFVILSCLPLGYFIFLLPNDLIKFSNSLISTLFFYSNFYFFNSGQEYGATDSLLIPFLHSWSLSVEEQFYIVFPILIIFLFKFNKKYLPIVLIVLLILSLTFSEFGSRNFEKLNFYFVFSRVWEIFFGSLIAYFQSLKKIKSNKNGIAFKIMPQIGLLILLFSILMFDKNTRHPSLITIFPVIATGIIIYYSNTKNIVTKILSTKPFVYAGMLSYSLYLWHYPIFAFSRITHFASNNLINKVLIVIIVLLLSTITYFIIERPARNKSFRLKKIIIIFAPIFLLILLINIFIIYKKGFEEKYNNIYIKNNIFNYKLKNESWQYVNNSNQTFNSSNKLNILLIGDSFSKDLYNLFYVNKELFSEYEFVRFGKKFNEDAFLFDENYSQKKVQNFEKSLLFKKSDYIIISDHFLDMNEVKNLDHFINYFKYKKKIILTSNSNIYLNNLKYKRFHKLTLFDYYLIKDKETIFHIDKKISKKDIEKINQYYFENKIPDQMNLHLRQIAKQHNIKFLDKNTFMCIDSKNICFGSTNEGFKTSYDGRHFTLEGAKFFGQKVFENKWFRLN